MAAILQWRPRRRRTFDEVLDLRFPAVGEYAGRARYLPGAAGDLSPSLRAVAGTVVDVQFAGIAPAGPWAGQSLYQLCASEHPVLDHVVPERDLDFLP